MRDLKVIFRLAVICLFLPAADRAVAQDSNQARTAELRQSLISRARAVWAAADETDRGLERYRTRSRAAEEARGIVRHMLDAPAWRDLASRDSGRRLDALAALESYLARANRQLALAQRELADRRNAEYTAWARANPERARTLELQRRLQNAEEQAAAALEEARLARREAEQARILAEEAKQQAERAGRRWR